VTFVSLSRLALAVTALLATGACASGTAGPASAGAASITVYSGQHEQTVKLLTDGFTKETGIAVRLRSGNEAELANQIVQEGSASPADVFFAGNPPPLEAVREKGLLTPVDVATLTKVPSQYNSPARLWVGVSARVGALIVSTSGSKPVVVPNTLQELASSAWKGRFAYAPTETDFTPIVSALAKVKGDRAASAFLTALKANGKAYEDNEAIAAAVNRGDVQVGLVEHYYWYRLKQELGASGIHSELRYFAPGDPGGLLAVSGAGVLASSKHSREAQQFLAYLVSPAGQAVIATSQSYEYPLATGAATKQPLKPFGELRPPGVSSVELGDGRTALALLQQANLL
jgi:iron(III) transport system substrate-binding protein